MSLPCDFAIDMLIAGMPLQERCSCGHVMAVHGLDGVCDVCQVENAVDAVADQLNDLQ